MTKNHRAVQTGPNKWEKRTGWKLSTSDTVSLVLLAITVGYIVGRILIG